MNNKKSLILIIFLLLISSVNAFDLTSNELEKSVCPSSTILLNANVFGIGSFTVNADGSASNWATVVPQGFILNNELKLIYVYVTPRFNANPGIYDLNLNVNSNNEIKKINYKINVPDCHNLVISGDKSKNVCGCNYDVYNYTISNNGIYQESYKIEVNGKASSWINLNQDSFSLNPGQSKTIYAYLNAPCGSDFGENDFTITVRSLTSNAIASFDSNVIVNSCFDFNANVDREFVNMCEHTNEIVPVKIDNLANLDNDFDLKITGPAWANLGLSKLNLSSKNSGIVNLILNPDYKVQGDFDVKLNIKSRQSKISKDINLKINVRKCNDVSLELLTKEDKICSGSEKYYEANIKNTGEFEKDFRIETNLGWVKPADIIIHLKQNENKKVKIEFNPGNNISSGNYKVDFSVFALDSSMISSKDTFNLDLISKEQCYKPEVNVQDVEVNADSSATSKIEIKNIGAEKATYELGLSGNANTFSQLNPSTITIEPGKNDIVYLYIAPPYNTKPGDYKANIFLNLKGLGILDSKTINIKVNPPGEEIKLIKEENKTISLWEKFLNLFKVENLNQTIVPEEKIIDLDKETIIDEDIKFNLNNEVHSLKIIELINDSVKLRIESNPVEILLKLNQTKGIDLDNDTKTDLVIKLNEIKDNKPVLAINKINEGKEENQEFTKLKDSLYKYRFILLIGVIIIIGSIIFFSTKSHKKIIDYLEEDSEDEKPIKVGRYILLVLILIVLLWYYKNYGFGNLLNYLSTYKFYIVAGLIILIFLILIINYWKEIVDFFEEDIEEEKPKKKKL